jgi:hypothetical protein
MDAAFKKELTAKRINEVKAPLCMGNCGFSFIQQSQIEKMEKMGNDCLDKDRQSVAFFDSVLIGLMTSRRAYRTFDAKKPDLSLLLTQTAVNAAERIRDAK